jgi:hypothetical protein
LGRSAAPALAQRAVFFFFGWRRLIHSKQGRAHIRRLHPDWAARPALMRGVFFLRKGSSSSLLLRSACALQKKHGMRYHSPRKGQRPRSQQLPSCCQGRSQRERQPRPPLLSHPRERGGTVLTAERPGLFGIVSLFPLASLPAAVASPPPCLLCSKRGPRLLLSLGPSTSMTTCLWWSRSAWARCDSR